MCTPRFYADGVGCHHQSALAAVVTGMWVILLLTALLLARGQRAQGTGSRRAP
jgi:hypothetical protein